jgi:small conductance mechanosensitive channel
MTNPIIRLLAAAGDAGGGTNQIADLIRHPVRSFNDYAVDFLTDHGAAYCSAIVALAVGFLAAHWFGGVVGRTLDKQRLEPPVRLLMVRAARLAVMALSLVIALDAAGFKITALVTGLGVAGVGIGLGMQGLLSNMVAGLSIIFTKPFRVGEYIAMLGVEGLVKHIDLVSTTLEHGDASRVVIPNHKIIGEILHNYGITRQLNLSVGVSYGADLKKAQALVVAILEGNPRVLKNPAPVVTVSTLGDSSIVISIQPWVRLEDVGPATSELNEAIIERFRASGVEIPFLQREIRMVKEV